MIIKCKSKIDQPFKIHNKMFKLKSQLSNNNNNNMINPLIKLNTKDPKTL
jgi:hypothetical protein